MSKIKRIFILLVMFNIIITTMIGFFKYNTYAFVEQTLSSDIDKIDDSKYPGIKSMILNLQKDYKNWSFKVLYTNLKWEDVIKGESVHGNNLVPKNSIYYDRDWICTECGTDKVYDTGKYYCASEDAIKYMMDPRNSIYYADIFQFLQLSYIECKYEDLKAMVANCSYLNDETIIKQIMEMGKEKDINPSFVIAKIIQEQGEDKKDSKGNIIEKSPLVTGKKYVGTNEITYEGYYNFLNVGATGSGNENVITNGLKHAKKMRLDNTFKIN